MTPSFLVPPGDLKATVDRPPVELPAITMRRMARERVVTRHRAEPNWPAIALWSAVAIDLVIVWGAHVIGRAGAC